MPLLFAYGTLQMPEVQQSTFGRLLDGRRDALVGFELASVVVTDPRVVALSGKTQHTMAVYTGNREQTVPGTAFDVTDEELERADDYEPEGYHRVLAPLLSGGRAWVYVDASQRIDEL